MEAGRVHVVGASGSGTTTLGRALASEWSVPHGDVDDFYWEPTDPPFTTKRDPPERLRLLEAVLLPRAAWVLSGSVVSWGEALIPRFDAVVFLTLDPSTRLARLEERERRRYGGRIEAGGDREAAFREFRGWAAGYDDPSFAGRSLATHERWLAALPCPVLRLDGARPVPSLVAAVVAWEPPAAP